MDDENQTISTSVRTNMYRYFNTEKKNHAFYLIFPNPVGSHHKYRVGGDSIRSEYIIQDTYFIVMCVFTVITQGEGAAAGSGYTWQIWRLTVALHIHTPPPPPRAFIFPRTPLRRIYTVARTSVSVLLSSYHHVLLRVLSDLIARHVS